MRTSLVEHLTDWLRGVANEALGTSHLSDRYLTDLGLSRRLSAVEEAIRAIDGQTEKALREFTAGLAADRAARASREAPAATYSRHLHPDAPCTPAAGCVEDFVRECCVDDARAVTTFRDLRAAYVAWCANPGRRPYVDMQPRPALEPLPPTDLRAVPDCPRVPLRTRAPSGRRRQREHPPGRPPARGGDGAAGRGTQGGGQCMSPR